MKKANTIIENNTFTGVVFDKSIIEVMNKIAEGLTVNAEGLKYLAEIIKASNIHIEAMVKIDSPTL